MSSSQSLLAFMHQSLMALIVAGVNPMQSSSSSTTVRSLELCLDVKQIFAELHISLLILYMVLTTIFGSFHAMVSTCTKLGAVVPLLALNFEWCLRPVAEQDQVDRLVAASP